MAETQPTGNYQRARSQDAKRERHAAILRAAREHLIEVGFEKFSMGPLAASAGIARATLYLYFPTREELLLELYFDSTIAALREFRVRVRSGMSAETFVEIFYEAGTADPPLLELAPHLGTVIESNVSTESFIEAKRRGRRNLEATVDLVSEALAMPREIALEVFMGLFRLLLGTRQEMRNPNLDLSQLPDDVCESLIEVDEKAAFLRAGLWLMKGAQRG